MVAEQAGNDTGSLTAISDRCTALLERLVRIGTPSDVSAGHVLTLVKTAEGLAASSAHTTARQLLRIADQWISSTVVHQSSKNFLQSRQLLCSGVSDLMSGARLPSAAKAQIIRAMSFGVVTAPATIAHMSDTQDKFNVRVSLALAWANNKTGSIASVLHYAVKLTQNLELLTPVQHICADLLCAVGYETAAVENYDKALVHWRSAHLAASLLSNGTPGQDRSTLLPKAVPLIEEHINMCILRKTEKEKASKAEPGTLGEALLDTLLPRGILLASSHSFLLLHKSLSRLEGMLGASAEHPQPHHRAPPPPPPRSSSTSFSRPATPEAHHLRYQPPPRNATRSGSATRHTASHIRKVRAMKESHHPHRHASGPQTPPHASQGHQGGSQGMPSGKSSSPAPAAAAAAPHRGAARVRTPKASSVAREARLQREAGGGATPPPGAAKAPQRMRQSVMTARKQHPKVVEGRDPHATPNRVRRAGVPKSVAAAAAAAAAAAGGASSPPRAARPRSSSLKSGAAKAGHHSSKKKHQQQQHVDPMSGFDGSTPYSMPASPNPRCVSPLVNVRRVLEVEAERGEGRAVCSLGVVGMTFDAMVAQLAALPGWRAALPESPRTQQSPLCLDVLLGEKLQVEALLENVRRLASLPRKARRQQPEPQHGPPGGGGRVRCDTPAFAAAALARWGPMYVNYFLGSRVITLKSKMVELLRAHCKDPWRITPMTFIVAPRGAATDERQEFLGARGGTWIAKSSHGSKGLGIKISPDKRTLLRYIDRQEKRYKWVIQLYLESPFLIEGRKFDIRTWVLLAPDRKVWVYKRGVCRTSSYLYQEGRGNLDDHLTHITNHYIQEGGDLFEKFEKGNELWFHQLHDVMQDLPEPKSFYKDLEPQLNRITKTAFDAALPAIAATPKPLESFQLFGFDFLVDSALRVWLLEVNGSPAIAEYLKDDMVRDMCEVVLEDPPTVAALAEQRGSRANDFVLLR